jgi:hypothetical protein
LWGEPEVIQLPVPGDAKAGPKADRGLVGRKELAMTTGTVTWAISLDGLSPAKITQLFETVSFEIDKIIGSTNVRRPSSEDAEGWTRDLYDVLLTRLRTEGSLTQAEVLEAAVAAGGAIDRATTYELAGWDPSRRSLKGFTRPVNRVVADMRAEGLLPVDAPKPFVPIYSAAHKGYQKAGGFSVPANLVDEFTQ